LALETLLRRDAGCTGRRPLVEKREARLSNRFANGAEFIVLLRRDAGCTGRRPFVEKREARLSNRFANGAEFIVMTNRCGLPSARFSASAVFSGGIFVTALGYTILEGRGDGN